MPLGLEFSEVITIAFASTVHVILVQPLRHPCQGKPSSGPLPALAPTTDGKTSHGDVIILHRVIPGRRAIG